MDTMRPILNLNGTHPQDLINARVEARKALRAAINALEETAPNGRDYIGHPDALARDQKVHRERIQFLDGLQNALMDEAVAIQDAAGI